MEKPEISAHTAVAKHSDTKGEHGAAREETALPGAVRHAAAEPGLAQHSAALQDTERSALALRQVVGLAVTIVAALMVVYGVGVLFFSTHFGFNSTIDGRNVSFLTVDAAEDRIAINAMCYELTVEGREGFRLVIDSADIGLHYQPDGQVRSIFLSQNPLLWPARLVPQTASATRPSYVYEIGRMHRLLYDSGMFEAQNMRAPADARPVFVDGAWQIKNEDLGTTFDETATLQAVSDALTKGQSHCDLDLLDCYVSPTVFADSPQLAAEISEFNTYAPFTIVYVFGDSTETLDAFIAIEWFKDNSDGSKSLDMTALDAWLADFCLRHNTVGSERMFNATRGESVAVSGGSYGWLIDKKAERNAIVAAIANQSSERREPYYSQRAEVSPTQAGQPDWGGTYIEIDQSAQVLYYYVDGVQVFSTNIVTGLPTPKWTTPCGVYYVLTRVSPARLRGPIQEDGNPMWDSTVQFWMGVTVGGVGIHDAYWQPWFGGNRYMYGGSHGCINLPYSKARELFNMVEIGTPVIIFW